MRFQTDDIVLYSFSAEQHRAKMYREDIVHEMCNNEEYGSVNFKPTLHSRIMQVKIYQELCHEIFFVIHTQMLDYIPSIMRTMHTRLDQLHDLIMRWRCMTEEIRTSRFMELRIELTVQTHKVIDGRRLCSEQNLFVIEGIERVLGGTFGTSHKSIADFMETYEEFVKGFTTRVHGKNERTPSVKVRSALTFARSTIGWSGKFIENQLKDARAWKNVAAWEETRRVESLEELQYIYDGVQLDGPDERPLLQDFFYHAE